MTLKIDGIEVECIIGDLPEERIREQTLVVDAELEIPDRAAETDALADTVDYAAAAERVRAALRAAKCRMIERAAKVAFDALGPGCVRVKVVKRGAVAGIAAAGAVYPCADAADGETTAAAGRLVAALKAKGLRCATAESCTGGGVAAAITGVSGASEVFAGGAVVYENAAKEKVLGVSGETLRRHGAVSAETAAEMATGARRLYATDFAVSLTGIAGPGGGSAEKPVGLVWFGLASMAGVRTEKMVFPGNRAEVRAQAVCHALAMLESSVAGV